MTDNFSHAIRSQFPDIYKEEGDELISFLEAYYEFVEEQHSINREMMTLNDVDDTLEEFVVYFKEKYLKDFPFVSGTDRRFLIKNIVEFYRTKGSERSIKLLLRLLFKEEVEIYYPAFDILKPSASEWHEPIYLELTRSHKTNSFVSKKIIGSRSKATAYVEAIVTKRITGRLIDIVYISHIRGDFEKDDIISVDGELKDGPVVLGSLNGIEINIGGLGYDEGDILTIEDEFGVHGQARVTEVFPATNRVNFDLVNGGWGFSTNDIVTPVTITPLGTGAGAIFEIGEIAYPETVNVVTDVISGYTGVNLDAVAYGFPSDPSANLASTLAVALDYQDITIGQITRLTAINPGDGYNADVVVEVKTPAVATYRIADQIVLFNLLGGSFKIGELVTQDSPPARGIVTAVSSTEITVTTASFVHKFTAGGIITGADSFGSAEVTGSFADIASTNIIGDNAEITGIVQNADGLVSSVAIHDSGFGYLNGDPLTMQSETNEFTISGTAIVDSVGKGQGFWRTTHSHLNSEKKIRDSDYYQEFSYEVSAKLSLDRYKATIYDLVHPAGTKLFGQYKSTSNINLEPDLNVSFGSGDSIFEILGADPDNLILNPDTEEYYNGNFVTFDVALGNK